MEASIEISMYPLNSEYLDPIQNFIDRLHEHPTIEVRTNTLSTQLFGSLDDLMDVLKSEIAVSYQNEGKATFVLKILKGNLA
ncbi:MAG: hypothetical protein LAT76_00020 [Schleiferiaceae bacterium]|nr:hypothetical protein [Schleiferiaceae bacterium]